MKSKTDHPIPSIVVQLLDPYQILFQNYLAVALSIFSITNSCSVISTKIEDGV